MSEPLKLLDAPADDTLIKDSFKHVRDRLAQVPEGKTGALVVAVDWKLGVLPTLKTGIAHRTANGWEIAGEGFISKAGKGASVRAVKTWVLLFSLLFAAPAFAQSTRHERVDQVLLIGGLTASSTALGITMSCTSAGTCREVNPLMGNWIGESAVRASVAKSAINGALYYSIWRLSNGKTRTIGLIVLTAFNTFDAVHDIRQMRKIER